MQNFSNNLLCWMDKVLVGNSVLLVALVILYIALRSALVLVPFAQPMLRLVFASLALLSILVFMQETLYTVHMLALWLVLGLLVYLYVRYRQGAEAREAEAKRIQNARNQERHRVPPPAQKRGNP